MSHGVLPTLLVAEDDADNCLLIREAIDAAEVSVDVRFVLDGEELLDYLKQRGRYASSGRASRPHLLLLDVHMPGKTGPEVLREIRDDPELRMLPVVMFTSETTPERVDEAYLAGAHGFVRKPESFEQLVHAIQTICRYWFEVVTLPRREFEPKNRRIGRGRRRRRHDRAPRRILSPPDAGELLCLDFVTT